MAYALKPGQPTWRPQYPGYPTQTYRIGDHLYSSGGSEAQKPPNRVTHCKHVYQWQVEHLNQVTASQHAQVLGATDRAMAKATIHGADARASALFGLSTSKIGDKMDVTTSLNNDLKKMLAEVEAEMARLDQCMADTKATLDSKMAPIDAVAGYIALRKTRYQSERLCDPVKKDLETMRATLNESVRLLDSALAAQVNEKMRLMVKKAALEADIADKTAAHGIDTVAKGISPGGRPETAPEVGSYAGAAGSALRAFSTAGALDRTLLFAPYDPVQWRMTSKSICEEARKVIQVAARLRDKSAQLQLDRQAEEASVYSDLVAHWHESIAAIKEVMARTEAQIGDCKSEVGALGALVSSVESSFNGKQESIGVAAERLSWRSTRPMRELVQDPAQRALANELANLKVSSRTLQGSAYMLNLNQQNLAKTIDSLEEAMALKQSSLDIEVAGEPIMGILKANASRLGQEAFAAPATMTPGVLSSYFRAPDKRPITSLPASRLSLSRVYATR